MNAWTLPQHAVKLGERGPIFSCPEVCPSPSTCPPNMGGCCVCEEVCPTGAITYAFEIVLEADQDEDELSSG